MLARLFDRRRPEADPPPAPDRFTYADPPHTWRAARVYELTAEQALAVAEGEDLLTFTAPTTLTGPHCVRCGEDWAPAVAYMPCRR